MTKNVFWKVLGPKSQNPYFRAQSPARASLIYLKHALERLGLQLLGFMTTSVHILTKITVLHLYVPVIIMAASAKKGLINLYV